MLKTRRQPGDRRWGLQTEFPLRDSSGVVVARDRRRLPERRRTTFSIQEWVALLLKSRHERG